MKILCMRNENAQKMSGCMARSIVNDNDQNIPFSKQYLKFTTCVLVSLLRANISLC